jgi:hypothetical protein
MDSGFLFVYYDVVVWHNTSREQMSRCHFSLALGLIPDRYGDQKCLSSIVGLDSTLDSLLRRAKVLVSSVSSRLP